MENLLHLLPKRPQTLAIRYGVTAAIVLIFFALRVALDERSGYYGFYLMFPAIFLASVLFDRGSGFFATALSVLLLALLVPPRGSLWIEGPHVLPTGLFAIICLGLVTISEALRGALERAVAAEQAKDLLLHELAHRSKNNMALAASVLGLQANAQSDPKIRAALQSAMARIAVIAQAHDHLQQTAHEGVIDMKHYLQELCRKLGDSLRGVRPVAIRVDVDPVLLAPEKAVPIGLIANELVTNAFKYAFPDQRAGSVTVSFRGKDRGVFELRVADNGVGCPETAPPGLGGRIVDLLVQQLSGTLTRVNTDPGCTVLVTLPADEIRAKAAEGG